MHEATRNDGGWGRRKFAKFPSSFIMRMGFCAWTCTKPPGTTATGGAGSSRSSLPPLHHAHGHSRSYRCRLQPVPTSRDNAGPLDPGYLVTKYFPSEMRMDTHGASGNVDNWGLRLFTKFSPLRYAQAHSGSYRRRHQPVRRLRSHRRSPCGRGGGGFWRRSSVSSTLGSREGRAFLHQLVTMTTRGVLKVDLDPGGRRGAQEVREVLLSSRT